MFCAADAGLAVLQAHGHRIARTGRLRASEDRAVDLIHAIWEQASCSPLSKPLSESDGLSDAAREAVSGAVLDEYSDAASSAAAGIASALRADLR